MAEPRWFPTVVLTSLLRRRGRRCRGALSAEHPSLADCPSGYEGTISEVVGEGPLASRLREMGVVPGSKIRVLRAGNPIVFQLAEGRYCIRRRDARCLLISKQ